MKYMIVKTRMVTPRTTGIIWRSLLRTYLPIDQILPSQLDLIVVLIRGNMMSAESKAKDAVYQAV
jgi:hypothetical protein